MMPCFPTDLSLFNRSVETLLLLLPQFHLSTKFWKELNFHESPYNLFSNHFQMQELKRSQAFPPVTEKKEAVGNK